MSDARTKTRKDRGGLTKASWNERLKFVATCANTAGAATLGFGLLAPLLGNVTTPFGVQSVLSGAIYAACFALGWLALSYLED